MKRHWSSDKCQLHVQGIKYPDQAENAQPDADVDKDLTSSHSFLLFLFLLVRNWRFLFLLRARPSISDVLFSLSFCILVGLPEIKE